MSPITVVAIDDDSSILRLTGRAFGPRYCPNVSEVATFLEAPRNSKVEALVNKVRDALAAGHRVVVITDGTMPNDTTPLIITEALQTEGLLVTRAALEAWIADADMERPTGAPVVLSTGGIGDTNLQRRVDAALKEGTLVGVLLKGSDLATLRGLVLALAMAERDQLRDALKRLPQTA